MDLWVPEAEALAGVVLWVHGGAFLFGDRLNLPPTLRPNQLRDAVLDQGLAFATIDYRLSGEAPFPAQLHDVKAAIRYLRHFAADLGLDPQRIGIWGESAGGHLASFAAVSQEPIHEGEVGVTGVASQVACCIDWYGPVLFEEMPKVRASMDGDGSDLTPEELLVGAWAKDRPDLLAAASPYHFVTSDAPPILIMHGDADGLVPVGQSERFAEKLRERGAGVEFVVVPGADHIFAGHADTDDLVARSVQFLTQRLSVTH